MPCKYVTQDWVLLWSDNSKLFLDSEILTGKCILINNQLFYVTLTAIIDGKLYNYMKYCWNTDINLQILWDISNFLLIHMWIEQRRIYKFILPGIFLI